MNETIKMQAAIRRIIGDEVANLYDDVCCDWIDRVPEATSLLDEDHRPAVVPASVVPYGRSWLGWIERAGKAGATIHIPTRHAIRAAKWGGAGVLEDTGNLLGVLRHEVGHHVQKSLMRHPTHASIRGDVHLNTTWLRTIAHWHRLADVELFVRQSFAALRYEVLIAGGASPMGRLLRSYWFSDELPASLACYVPELPPADLPTVREVLATCAHCGDQFSARRSTAKFCGTACRVAHHRAGGEGAAAP